MVNSISQYYLTTYASKTVSRYDTHKKSELRGLYNNIVKLSKESPLYKINFTEDTGRYAIDIKETARNTKNILTSLSGDSEDGSITGFSKRAAQSSDENIISASYIGSPSDSISLSGFDIEVENQATSQINMGNFLEPEKMELEPDIYSFDIAIGELSYEFLFGVEKDDTNRSLQEKLARMIKDANIGLTSNVIEDGFGHTSLKLESTSTGLTGSRKLIFAVSDKDTSKASGSVAYLGINSVNQYPENLTFYLNGMKKTSSSNTFTVNKTFELTVHSATGEDSPVHIGFKTDTDSIIDNVSELVSSHNSLLEVAKNYSGSQERSNKLISDVGSIAKLHKNSLDAIGLSVKEDGSISLDEGLLVQSLEETELEETFGSLKTFRNDLLGKTNRVFLDPLEYVNKVVVAYKNPGKTFAAPYITSMYSGLMFDGRY